MLIYAKLNVIIFLVWRRNMNTVNRTLTLSGVINSVVKIF